eukprot:CAMPEP_0202867768 /NCGR_PEP_ID=MMETSP1391-20130828/9612_1 /ASSEMBLY_ACC=CAM_ASM_000867 /TAXON_ID=1034604 /ORGANISM="Chlamydomonas leiostraca, Strain SAG 11-49" /LENGTH=178 /DNA_ID=CAMNT_0049547831 /DNA_START=39 /DNA_END=575 /DNA_ORIENTATION=+
MASLAMRTTATAGMARSGSHRAAVSVTHAASAAVQLRVARASRPEMVRAERAHVIARADAAPAATAAATTEGLHELNQETFYPYLEEHRQTLVVVDFYTDWCGPCKVMYPELVKLSQEKTNIKVVKFNCNKQNKELGVKLKIKVAPTFHLYKNNEKVAEMTGAKIDKLRALIDEQLAA